MSSVGVVIPAAGRGERAGGETPKQFREIGHVPMLLRTLRPFTAHPRIDEIVVALPSTFVKAPPTWLIDLVGTRLRIVAGGATRADSVQVALEALSPGRDIVIVHDAARPFVSRETIDAVIVIAEQGDGAVPCIALADTVKRTVEGSDAVLETVSRAGLWRAQTPQAFPVAMLRDAYGAVGAKTHEYTDDASLVEAHGGRVRIVPDLASNIKVTSPDDFLVAEALANR